MNQILMLLFAVVKLQVIYYFRCTLCQHLNSFLTSLPLFSQNMAFIFLQIICFVKLFPHSLVMDPTGQENIARNINT